MALPSLHDYDVKMPNFTYCGVREHKTTTLFFFSWTSLPSYKHERGWENSRQLCKPETKSRVCITVENSPNASSAHIRLCKHRKKVFYCFYKITFPFPLHSPVLIFIQSSFNFYTVQFYFFTQSSFNIYTVQFKFLHSPVVFFTKSSFNIYTVQFYFLHSPVLFFTQSSFISYTVQFYFFFTVQFYFYTVNTQSSFIFLHSPVLFPV